jgi:hypothetical protein
VKALLGIFAIFILSLFISHQPERCEHILIKDKAYGITQTYITMCGEYQVDDFGTHKQTERSIKYFGGNEMKLIHETSGFLLTGYLIGLFFLIIITETSPIQLLEHLVIITGIGFLFIGSRRDR